MGCPTGWLYLTLERATPLLAPSQARRARRSPHMPAPRDWGHYLGTS